MLKALTNMPRYLFYLWLGYVGLMGFALGGSVVSAFLAPSAVEQSCAGSQTTGTDCQAPEQGQHATESALSYYTKWLMVFTGVLAFATIGMGIGTLGLYSANQDQLRLARTEFTSSHRPRMRLKHMWLTSDTDWRLDHPLEVNLDIVNIGNTEGFITWINYISILLPIGLRLPQRPPYDEMPFGPDMRITRFRGFTSLKPGITLARPVCDGTILDPQEVLDVLWERKALFLIGTIEYFDQGGGLRQTGFCRRLVFNKYPPAAGELGRFEIPTDPDYEFEEWSD